MKDDGNETQSLPSLLRGASDASAATAMTTTTTDPNDAGIKAGNNTTLALGENLHSASAPTSTSTSAKATTMSRRRVAWRRSGSSSGGLGDGGLGLHESPSLSGGGGELSPSLLVGGVDALESVREQSGGSTPPSPLTTTSLGDLHAFRDQPKSTKAFLRLASQALMLMLLTRLCYLSMVSDLEAEEWEPPTPLPRLPTNRALSKAQYVLTKDLFAPESLAIDPRTNVAFTGTLDGRIVRFSLSAADPDYLVAHEFARFNKSCDAFAGTYEQYPREREWWCGRPLGMHFDAQNRLVVVEAYSGVYRFSRDGSKREHLLSHVRGRPIVFANDVVVDSRGVAFLTISSQRWGREKVVSESLSAKKQGLLVEFDTNAGSPEAVSASVRVWDGFMLPNGVALSENERLVYFVSGSTVLRLDRTSGLVLSLIHI